MSPPLATTRQSPAISHQLLRGPKPPHLPFSAHIAAIRQHNSFIQLSAAQLGVKKLLTYF